VAVRLRTENHNGTQEAEDPHQDFGLRAQQLARVPDSKDGRVGLTVLAVSLAPWVKGVVAVVIM